MLAPKHVRLRVDPKKIRVLIRKHDMGRGVVWWCCTLVGKSAKTMASGVVEYDSVSVDRAIDKAIKAAEASGMEGLNLGLDWAYGHPQYVDDALDMEEWEESPCCQRCHTLLSWEGDPPEKKSDAICNDCAWKELEEYRALIRDRVIVMRT